MIHGTVQIEQELSIGQHALLFYVPDSKMKASLSEPLWLCKKKQAGFM